jgi:hypothetical protein
LRDDCSPRALHDIRLIERFSALFLGGCRPRIASILLACEPVAIEINGLLHGEFARTEADGS